MKNTLNAAIAASHPIRHVVPRGAHLADPQSSPQSIVSIRLKVTASLMAVLLLLHHELHYTRLPGPNPYLELLGLRVRPSLLERG